MHTHIQRWSALTALPPSLPAHSRLDICVHHSDLVQPRASGEQLLRDVLDVVGKHRAEVVGAKEIVQGATKRREH